MGDAPIGIVTAGNYSVAGKRPQNEAFLAAWKQAYGNNIANYIGAASWDGMAAIFDIIKQTQGKFDGDRAMGILKGWRFADSPRGPISIDPDTRDIIQTIYIRRTEKQPDGHLANIEFDSIPRVKDPWKEFNPPK
jgi:branched-chain amino acid transport system substrate-binding protein